MSTLAHEGNPTEDDITISGGSVLSTATLSINFNFFGGSGVPPENPGGGSMSSSCVDTLQIAEGVEATIPFYYNDPQSSGSITVFTDQGGMLGGVAPSRTWFNVSLETGTACCALAYTQVSMIDLPTLTYINMGSSETPDIRSRTCYPVHDISLNGVKIQGISDSPYFGICNFVQDGSTVHNFTGYVLASDVGAGITKLMKYVNGDLCGDGQILGTIAGAPNGQGDFMYLNVLTDPHSSSVGDTIWTIEAGIEDENEDPIGTPITLQSHDDLMDVNYTAITTDANTPVAGVGDRHNRANVGIVAIGGSTLSGIAILGADASHFGIRASCDSFSFAQGELA